MKKLMILAGVAAMAISAQAAAWTFRVDVNNIPSGMKLTEASTYYLLDTKNHEVLAYLSRSELQASESGGTTTWTWSGDAASKARVASENYITIGGVSYDLAAHTLGTVEMTHSTISGTPVFGTQLNFTTEADPSSYNSGSLTKASDLAIYVSDPEYSNYSLMLDPATENIVWDSQGNNFVKDKSVIGWASQSSLAGTIEFVAVPEPTSGLLLLLGVAGLALRRRRA